jgi:hypothetical protein
MKLYELTNQFKEIERMEDLDDQTMLDTLEGIEGDFLDKGQNVAAYFQNLDAEASALKEAENRITARRKSIENKSNSLKEYLLRNMQALNITKIECPEFSITLRKPSRIVEVYDESKLGDEFTVTKTITTPDKNLIKKFINDGFEINGARLIDGKQTLTIK